MSSTEYKIKTENITSNFEETSSILNISYETENANNNGLPKNKLK
ncbi:hypothetical protein [Staphylococcus epidermidis]|nr:hypothetical protein [Staphylococcus epidermidis]EKS31639.1 hypothetical protein HMPREF9281_01601 [Staphylococcus epidermidis BVS058A4]TID08423.1 hypothetical protein HMPREF9955_1227 [Staphylococcus epidermidis FS1]